MLYPLSYGGVFTGFCAYSLILRGFHGENHCSLLFTFVHFISPFITIFLLSLHQNCIREWKMASITKSGDTWLAQVRRKGVSKSKRFAKKTEAVLWAAKIEADLEAHARGELGDYTLLDAIERFEREVLPKHRSYRAEMSAMSLIKRSPRLNLNKRFADVSSADIAGWRDHRCAQVSDGTVNRELTLIKLMFSIAIREWGWITENPCLTVKKRPKPQNRNRLISRAERELIVAELKRGRFERGIRFEARIAFEFALETAMRLGEIVGLTPDDVTGRVAHLSLTKNGSARDVPLSKKALELLSEIEREGRYFTMTKQAISRAVSRCARNLGIVGLHFHDTRHQAITDLAKKLTVLELARMVGHSDLRSLMIYYNETAESLAEKLD